MSLKQKNVRAELHEQSRVFFPFTIFELLCSLPLTVEIVVTQIRGHIAGSPLPPPHHGSCLHICHEKDLADTSSLVDSRPTRPLSKYIATRRAYLGKSSSALLRKESHQSEETRPLLSRHAP